MSAAALQREMVIDGEVVTLAEALLRPQDPLYLDVARRTLDLTPSRLESVRVRVLGRSSSQHSASLNTLGLPDTIAATSPAAILQGRGAGRMTRMEMSRSQSNPTFLTRQPHYEQPRNELSSSLPLLGDPAASLASPIRPGSVPAHARRPKQCIQRGRVLLAAQRLPDASACLLAGLSVSPHSPLLQQGVATVTELFKYDEVERWASWPYAEPQSGRQHGRRRNKLAVEPPPRLAPPRSSYIGSHHMTLVWKSTAEEALKKRRSSAAPRRASDTGASPPRQRKPSQARRAAEAAAPPKQNAAAKFELQVAEVSPIDGLQAARTVYMGKECTYRLSGLLGEAEVRARVRGHNAKGGGEWSQWATLWTSEEVDRELKELDDIPASWRHIDIDDILKEWSCRGNTSPQSLLNELLECISRQRATIKIAFCYYSLVGASTSTDEEPNAMNMSQFLAFCKGAKFLQKRMTISDCDRLFLRATRAPAHTGEELKVSKSSNLRQHQFVAALIRLAAHKTGNASSLTAGLERMFGPLSEHVHNELNLVHDSFSEVMAGRAMKATLHKHKLRMQAVFSFYASEDAHTAETRGKMSTINIRELNQMCQDAAMYNSAFGLRDMVASFVRVNIDDELYEQEDAENTPSELVFDEYEEVVARIFHSREWVHKTENTGAADAEGVDTLEQAFDKWLDDIFLPLLQDVMKQRKKGGGK